MRSETGTLDGLEYLVFAPEVEQAGRPLIVFLHGSGERGPDVPIEGLTVHSLPGLAARGELPRLSGAPFPFVLVCPHTSASSWLEDLGRVERVVEHVLRTSQADPSRCYATGISMGAVGCWELAATAPGHYAALAPVSWPLTPVAATVHTMPAWLFAGARDPYFTAGHVYDSLARYRGGDDTQVSVSSDGGHDAGYWNSVYRRADLYLWLCRHRRAAA